MTVDEKLDLLLNKMTVMEGEITSVKKEVADLSRKFDKAMSIEHEKETMLLRLLALENDVRKIKEYIKAS